MYGNEIRREVENTNCVVLDGSRLKEAGVSGASAEA